MTKLPDIDILNLLENDIVILKTFVWFQERFLEELEGFKTAPSQQEKVKWIAFILTFHY